MQRLLSVMLVGMVVWLAADRVQSQQPKGGPSDGRGPVAAPPLAVADIHARGVLGSLSVPLGDVAEIEGTIVSGSETRQKALSGLYLLYITTVNGRTLEKPVRKEFNVTGFAKVDLASDHFQLYELRHGERAGSLDSAQIKELDAGYVGSRVRLLAYETGGFRGIPRNLPREFPVWQDVGFGFHTQLIVLKRLAAN